VSNAGNPQPTAANHVTALNTSQSEVSDELDLLAEDALGGWERVMTPVISPIEALAANSASYKDFLTGLIELTRTTDANALIESLALATFKARGLGDGDYGW
jgi:hypothetical protein